MSAFRSRIVLAALLFSALSLSCGKDEKSTGDKTVITFWHFYSEPAQKKALTDRIEAFEKENPGVKVELTDLSWNDGKTKIIAAFNSNQAPDVLELGSDWIAQFSSEGVLADQSAMKGDSLSRFSPEVLSPAMWKTGVYATPWVTDTRVLFVNTGLLEGAGVPANSPDSLWSMVMDNAEKVRAKDPQTYGFGANAQEAHRLYKKILIFFWSNGGQVLTEKGTPVVNSAQNIEALERYLELSRTGLIETQSELDQKFIQGKIAYWISGSWLADKIAKENPSLKYVTKVLPSFDGKQAYSFGGGEYLAISEHSSKKELAKKFVAFMTSANQALEFCKGLPGGGTPGDLSVASDPYLQTGIRKTFTDQLRFVHFTPVHPQWLEIEEILEEEVAKTFMENKAPKQALDDAQSRIGTLIQKDETVADH